MGRLNDWKDLRGQPRTAAAGCGFRYHPAAMDLNSLLLWMAGTSCLVSLLTALRRSPRAKGWIFVSLVILLTGGAAFWLRPEIAGFVAGTLWILFVLIPALALRSAGRWGLRQRYERAIWPARLAGILHPFDGVPQQTQLLQACHLINQGQRASAIESLRSLETSAPPATARVAAAHRRRLESDWAGLIAWIQEHVEPMKLLRDHSLLPLYVRALGENARLGEMLRCTAASRLSLHPQLVAFRNMCRMYCFAFTGCPAQVIETFTGSLAGIPRAVQRYWVATALYAQGEASAAEAELQAIQAAAPGMQLAIRQRQANPPGVAVSLLSDTDLKVLDHLQIQHEQERHFAYIPTAGRRAWATYGLVLANLIVFAIEYLLGAGRGNWLLGGTSSDRILQQLGAMQPDVLETHEFYRLLTANFLHFGYLHLLMNMLALLFLGPFVEYNMGRFWYLLLYLLSGVAVMATVLFLQLHSWMEADILVGASGAIMAMIGASGAILVRAWVRERAQVAPRRLGILAIIVVVQATFDHFTPQVSGAAHVAGVAWGFVLASLLPHRNRPAARSALAPARA